MCVCVAWYAFYNYIVNCDYMCYNLCVCVYIFLLHIIFNFNETGIYFKLKSIHLLHVQIYIVKIHIEDSRQ